MDTFAKQSMCRIEQFDEHSLVCQNHHPCWLPASMCVLSKIARKTLRNCFCCYEVEHFLGDGEGAALPPTVCGSSGAASDCSGRGVLLLGFAPPHTFFCLQ